MFSRIKKTEKGGRSIGREEAKELGAAYYSNSEIFHGRTAEILWANFYSRMRIIWWVYPVISKIYNQDNRFFSNGEYKKLSASANSVQSSSVPLACFVIGMLIEPDKKKESAIIVLIAKFM